MAYVDNILKLFSHYVKLLFCKQFKTTKEQSDKYIIRIKFCPYSHSLPDVPPAKTSVKNIIKQ